MPHGKLLVEVAVAVAGVLVLIGVVVGVGCPDPEMDLAAAYIWASLDGSTYTSNEPVYAAAGATLHFKACVSDTDPSTLVPITPELDWNTQEDRYDTDTYVYDRL